VVHSE